LLHFETPLPASFNHPIRLHQRSLRDFQAGLLCCFQIDDELEFHRLLNCQVGWLRTLEDLVDVNRRTAISLMFVGGI
jgi:hypothetical protein